VLFNTYARVQKPLKLDEIVAHVDEPIERTGETLISGELRLGNFVADAYRAATDVDIGVMHAGSLRTGPPLVGEHDCRGRDLRITVWQPLDDAIRIRESPPGRARGCLSLG